MLERPDAVLAAIPLLAISGLALRSAIALTGIGTGILAAPLAPVGYLAALVFVFREMLTGPVAEQTTSD